MRKATSFLIRMLCLVALVVSALPVQAIERVCVLGDVHPRVEKSCGMSCCAKPALPQELRSHGCCVSKGSAQRSSNLSCKCELRAKPGFTTSKSPGVSRPPQTWLMAIVDHGVAIGVPLTIELSAETRIYQPDSGPPLSSDSSPPSGRAPPVLRDS